MRRLVIAAAVGAAVAATTVPSLAATGTSGGVPIGISNDNGKVCVWVSEQVPQCVDTSPITDAIPADFSVGPVNVHVSTAGGVFVSTSVGSQPVVGASVANGWVCVGFSDEIPTCYPLNSVN